MRRFGAGQRYHPRRDFRRDRRLAGFAGLVAQQTLDPLSAKRCCHRHTVGRPTPMLCATRCAECRSAEASTMRARSTCLRGRLRSATIAANCSRSSALNTTHTCCAMAPPPTTAQYGIFRQPYKSLELGYRSRFISRSPARSGPVLDDRGFVQGDPPEIARTQIGRQQACGDQGAAPGAPRQPRDRSDPSARMGLHDLDPHIMRRAIAGTDPDHHRQPGRRRVEVGRQEQFVDTIGRAAPEGTPPRRAALRGTARRGSSALSRCAGPGGKCGRRRSQRNPPYRHVGLPPQE